ncbi:MAG TPA: hypothetical protein VF989_17250 [Polyangiaceae bacterium]
MMASAPLDELGHEELRAWLARALSGMEPLPRLTPDEAPHLAILRLEKTLKPAIRDSLRDAHLKLVRDFCLEGHGEPSYLEELLSLASAFRDPEAAELLADLALRFPELAHLAMKTRLPVLAALVDMPPPRSSEYWKALLVQDREHYSGMALSGTLASNPNEAVSLLPAMPDTVRAGQAAALKIDLTWDELPPAQRFAFVDRVRDVLAQCSSSFRGPVAAWVASKQPAACGTSSSLRLGICKVLGDSDSSPKTRTPKLCSEPDGGSPVAA